jgi:hypothetical protein
MEDAMSLGPEARRLLELGKDAGEPDDTSLARSRASLMKRVGVGTAVAATLTTVASTAKAAPLSYLPAAASIAPAAAAPAASLAAVPLVLKLAATAVLVAGIGAGSVAYRAATQAPRDSVQSTAVAPLRASPVSPISQARPAPARPAIPTDEPRDTVAAPVVPPSRAVNAPVVTRSPATAQSVAPTAAVISPPDPVPTTSLANDVASLREAQAALLAGRPRDALEAAERVQPYGPLTDEREGIRILAACAMSAPDARDRAAEFVARRPDAPLAIRVRAACLGGQ